MAADADVTGATTSGGGKGASKITALAGIVGLVGVLFALAWPTESMVKYCPWLPGGAPAGARRAGEDPPPLAPGGAASSELTGAAALDAALAAVQDVGDRELTTAELAQFNGADGGPVYIAIAGIVFDVSEGSDFYGKGEAYEVFAGRDATRALGLWSLKEKDIDMGSDLTGLSDKQIADVGARVEYYADRYPAIGRLVDS